MFIGLWQIISLLAPIVIWILGVGITLRLLLKKNSLSVTLSWLLIIYLIPVVGVFAYLLFGEINLGRKRAEMFKRLSPQYHTWFNSFDSNTNLTLNHTSAVYKPLFSLCRAQLGIPAIRGNKLHLLDNSDDIMDSIIEEINKAEVNIEMVFYIWQSGGRVDEVTQALLEARKRGVTVDILLDSVGSRSFFKHPDCNKMRLAGINIVEALHARLWRFFLRRIDLRQHRKIIVIDNHIAYTGSMNMVDPLFFKSDANVGQWVDVMVRIEGPVSLILHGLHRWDWSIENNMSAEQSMSQLNLNSCPVIIDEKYRDYAVQIIATGPGFPDDLMAQSLLTTIFSAQYSIVITSPYFVPSQSVVVALKTAALRGVKVKIIVPHTNDSHMVEWASRTFFDELLTAGVEIYRFRGGLLHTKSIVVDERLALVGTVNMDLRSFNLNFEVMMIVDDKRFANQLMILHDGYLKQSQAVELELWTKRPLLFRFWERVNFLFSPLL